MNERRSCPHHYHHHHHNYERQQQVLQSPPKDNCRILDNEQTRKTDTIDRTNDDIVNFDPIRDSARTTYIAPERSSLRNTAQRSSSINSRCNSLLKDREIAKLKALIFEKDNELIALTMGNKNALAQTEERVEREMKVWNEHKELLLASERAKFEEEKTRLLKNSQDQLKLEQERCQRLEQKLYDAQMLSSEAQLMLKESGRERINAVYGTKEQCRKEFQDEVNRLRSQFQTEKDAEIVRLQKQIQKLEHELDRASNENVNVTLHQRELFVGLETTEKTCVRSISDCIKNLHMAMDSPLQTCVKIPQIASFTYDQESISQRLPTRNIIAVLEDTINSVKSYIHEQKVQIETQAKLLNRPTVLTDRTSDTSNRAFEDDKRYDRNRFSQTTKSFVSKSNKENDHYFRDSSHLHHAHDNEYVHPPNNHRNPFPLTEEQNHTIDNLVQKLEDHIASELNRLTKQRLTIHVSNPYEERRSTAFHTETPKQVKFDSDSTSNIDNEVMQSSWVRRLQDYLPRSSSERVRPYDSQPSRSYFPSTSKPTSQDDDKHNSFSPTRANTYLRHNKVDI